jgi:hypothetical protein
VANTNEKTGLLEELWALPDEWVKAHQHRISNPVPALLTEIKGLSLNLPRIDLKPLSLKERIIKINSSLKLIEHQLS